MRAPLLGIVLGVLAGTWLLGARNCAADAANPEFMDRYKTGGLPSEAGGGGAKTRLAFDIGVVMVDLLRGGRTDSGGAPSSVAAQLAFSSYLDLAFAPHWAISPFVCYTPFGLLSPDGGSRSRELDLVGRLQYRASDWDYHAGGGIWNYTISGNGGSFTSTATGSATQFALPAGSVTSTLFLVDLGFSKSIGKLHTDIEFMITGIATLKRAADVTLSLGYDVL